MLPVLTQDDENALGGPAGFLIRPRVETGGMPPPAGVFFVLPGGISLPSVARAGERFLSAFLRVR
ncbi:hypothetical protein CG723_00720 [Streptomyces sp. CB01635]|nr:hypothetical protein CG723_00720 [Streptomyces sp. CB01635]